MSWEATAYVSGLRRCPDGAEISPAQKLLMFVLSNYHSPIESAAWPGIPRLADEGLTSISSVKRHLDYMEAHCLIERRERPRKGAKSINRYVFLELDDPQRLQEKLAGKLAGETVQIEPFFSAQINGSQTVHKRSTNGSQTVQKSGRYKDLTRTGTGTGTNHARSRAAGPSARAKGMRSKCPQVVMRLNSAIKSIYEAQVGSQASFEQDAFKQWCRAVNAVKRAGEELYLDDQIALALCDYTDEQIASICSGRETGYREAWEMEQEKASGQ